MAAHWTTTWSGKYPCLCYGYWTLYYDGKPVQTDIPFNTDKYHGMPADTYGTFTAYVMDDDKIEDVKQYTNGLTCYRWCEQYDYWLKTVAPESEWPKIYKAFRKNDWRYASCGGCI